MNIAFLSKAEINIAHLVQELSSHRVTVCRTRDELMAAMPMSEVLVVQNQGFEHHTVDAQCLGLAKQLRLIQHHGVTCDATDIEAATRLKIRVATVTGGNGRSVAEHALFLMLALARQAQTARRLLHEGHMGELSCIELEGKTLCLVGLGTIGKMLARMAKGLSMKVIGVRKSTATEDAHEAGVDRVYAVRHLHQALAASDLVVLALPLTAETFDLIGARELAAMKRGTMLINVSRGAHVNREALQAALKSGHLAGFATDAYWTEPADPRDPLLNDENVIVTPHMGGKSLDAIRRTVRAIRENIDKLENGQTLLSVVNA